MTAKLKKLWIGTSGYSYKDWAGGVFYPEAIPERKWFEYYSMQFETVELNITFYRLPRPAIFESWHRRAPKDFKFFIKGSRFITHIKKLKQPMLPLKKFFASIQPLKEKLAGVLWQLPPSMKADKKRFSGFLKALQSFPKTRHVFEFRHESWFQSEIVTLMKKSKAAFCMPDSPDFYEHVDVPVTASFVYIRRHGPDPGRRYVRRYAVQSLKKDARRIRRWLDVNKEVFVYFNNDIGGAAPRDAKRLIELIRCK